MGEQLQQIREAFAADDKGSAARYAKLVAAIYRRWACGAAFPEPDRKASAAIRIAPCIIASPGSLG
jgi:hypothetical protein